MIIFGTLRDQGTINNAHCIVAIFNDRSESVNQ